MPGEFELIDWFRRAGSGRAARPDLVRVGIGDDLAVLKWDPADLLLVGVDQVIDGVHFGSKVHTPQQIGRKLMNRNLSDCAAMACLPAAAVATVALPRGTTMQYAQDLYEGMRAAGAAFDCPIVGGDTASWDGALVMTLAILGRSAGITPITRSGARAGDGIYISGPLGGSILGRHMNFVPPIELARQLAAGGGITAMIDISDGLSRDLRHICRQSGVGARIDAAMIPLHADAVELSRRDGVPALDHALHDGEDHELLFTASRPVAEAFRIGTITPGDRIIVNRDGVDSELAPRGWEHTF